MWPYEASRETRTFITHLLLNLLLRIILLITVCIIALKIEPRIQIIPQDKLLCDFKRPHCYSYTPIWVMMILVIFTPLTLFWVFSRNIRETIDLILIWSLSLSLTAMITEIIKLSVGRPRPDFYYRCYPDGIMTDEYHCTGNGRIIIEGRKSFPSGHASFSFASLGILSLFLRGRISDGQSRALKVLCLLPLIIATIIGVSRCLDNHHHWEDVLVGAVIGFTAAYLCYYSDYRECDWVVECDLEQANDTAPTTVIEVGN